MRVVDPLAHTLVGVTLAKSGLEKRSGFATTALVVGANLPDMDGITYFLGDDLPFLVRRGWTHGLAAIFVLPLILAAVLVLLDRVLGYKRARFNALLPLSFLAVASHPLLDWLNNYGMRWLMPFDGTWFYGDTLFIVDPWIWLALGGAAFLATSREPVRVFTWIIAGAGTAFLMWIGPFDSAPGRMVFFFGIGVFAVLRFLGLPRTDRGLEQFQRVALILVGVYILSMFALSMAARRVALAEFRGRGIEVERLMIGPVPMRPFNKDIMVRTPNDYRYGALTLWPSMTFKLDDNVIPRPQPSPILARALAQPEVRGFSNWARFMWAEVIEEPEGHRVILHDARLVRYKGPREGFGTAMVFLPRDSAP